MPWVSLHPSDPHIEKIKEMFRVSRLPHLVVISNAGAIVSKNARGNNGFGFGCDPVDAMIWLHREAGLPPPQPIIGFSPSIDDRDAEPDFKFQIGRTPRSAAAAIPEEPPK